MNEIIFPLHVFLVLIFLVGAMYWGREALIVFIAFSSVLANFFVVKQMRLFGLDVTCSDVFAIGGALGVNLLQEIYTRRDAQRAIRLSLACLVFFAAMSQVHLWYVPSVFDTSHTAYSLVLSPAPRLVAASLIVYYIVQYVDVGLFGFFKNVLKGRYLAFRLLFCLTFTQLLDTVLFSFLGLYGVVVSLFDIILVSFIVKCAMIVCASPVAAFAKRWARPFLLQSSLEKQP